MNSEDWMLPPKIGNKTLLKRCVWGHCTINFFFFNKNYRLGMNKYDTICGWCDVIAYIGKSKDLNK